MFVLSQNIKEWKLIIVCIDKRLRDSKAHNITLLWKPDEVNRNYANIIYDIDDNNVNNNPENKLKRDKDNENNI